MLPEPVGKIGLALGSGAARGWSHVGVIRELEARGLKPEIVCGSSSGAVVGALYAAGRLEKFEEWGRQLDWRQIVSYFDLSMRGGLIKARKLLDFLTAELRDRDLASLDLRFAAVATDLATGREIWLRQGPVFDALRASMALPGLVAPVRIDGRWLVDGGLVNAVPVSLCRAMGADTVIAVDLNTTLLSRRHSSGAEGSKGAAGPVDEPASAALIVAGEAADAAEARSMAAGLQDLLAMLREKMSSHDDEDSSPPSIYEVVATSINIMQVRITRSRMAGDPPDLLVAPRLNDFALLDFDRADDAIEEGRRAVTRALAAEVVGDPND